MTSDQPTDPVTVAVVDEHELVVCGVAAMLAPHADRVEVLDIDPAGTSVPDVDIVLFDALTCAEPPMHVVEELVADTHVGEVVLYTWDLTHRLITSAAARGAHSSLSKSLDARSLATALSLVQDVDAPTGPATELDLALATESRFAPVAGLTRRESEIVALITGGLSNHDIAEQTYLSINSVKSYIRSAYRTMGVTSRSRAVLWGIDHGFAPTRSRLGVVPISAPHSQRWELEPTGSDQLGSPH